MKFVCLVLACFIYSFAKNSGVDDQIKEGNLALSASQQPGPLFGFGQNIVDEGDLVFYIYADYIKNKAQKSADAMPGFLYGFKDNLSLFFNIPVTIKPNSEADSVLAGASAQLEYAYFTKTESDFEIQATVLAAISGPNGSMIKQVTSNRESSTFFIGGTCSYISVDWYIYCAIGELFSIKSKSKLKLGNNFLYQCGLGRNICHNKDYIYLILVEFLGSRLKKNIIDGVIDPASGGNILFFAPSLWVSSKHVIAQFGLSIPVYQRLINKYDYQIALNLGVKF